MDDEAPQPPGPLAHLPDREVIAAYEKAAETFEEPAMTIAADEMERRNLDY